ncbi:MAG: ComF family protein [Pseudomonadota bacterium]
MFQKILRPLYAWLAPYTCILCHYPTHREQDLCQPCLNELPILPQSCPRCANILAFTTAPCGSCLKKPPLVDRTHVLFIYQTPITKLLMELKFHENLVNARLFGELMTTAIQQQWYRHQALPHVLVPVPLHPQRLQERGFNQALEISRPIAKTLKLELDTRHCFRLKNTNAQARQSAKQRQQNLRGAFQITRNFTGLRVAILDDVITTGSTLRAFSKALKKAGASEIHVWCCAKSIMI